MEWATGANPIGVGGQGTQRRLAGCGNWQPKGAGWTPLGCAHKE